MVTRVLHNRCHQLTHNATALPLRASFGVRSTCTSLQRCCLNLCSGSSLFPCLFQQLCHLFDIDNRQWYVHDFSIARLVSFVSYCLHVQLVTSFCVGKAYVFFLPWIKNVYRRLGVAVCRQWTFLNVGRKLLLFWDVMSCGWISSCRRFGGSYVLVVEQSSLGTAWPWGQILRFLSVLCANY
jgi:hypothetical protein